MKSYQIILLFLLSILTFSCVDDLTNYGFGIQPKSDEISIGTDTIHLQTSDSLVDYLISHPDSFLLGTFYNEKYGSTHADILAQVKSPFGKKFPLNSVPDSAELVLQYNTWFGDKYAPMDVNVYEMNLKTFIYTDPYSTNIVPTDYSDLSILLGHRIFTAKDVVKTRGDSTKIRIKLSSDFVQRFYKGEVFYNIDSAFTKFFKGIYITTNYGSSTIINIAKKGIYINYYTHYTYTPPGTNKLDTVKETYNFPANDEVRQVNRFSHPDRTQFVKLRDSVNYVASPANLLTCVNIPLHRIKQKIDANVKMNGKKQLLNNALLRVDITEVENATLAMPVVNYMLLIKESAINDFFDRNQLPADTSTCAVLGKLSYSKIGSTNSYKYYYSYDVAKIIANELAIAAGNNTTPIEKLKMVLVPVSITTTESSSGTVSITSMKQQYSMSGVTIRSGKEYDSSTGKKIDSEPMHLKLVYSGF